jgi:hypothetical protein
MEAFEDKIPLTQKYAFFIYALLKSKFAGRQKMIQRGS